MNFGDFLDKSAYFGGGCERTINDISNSKGNDMSAGVIVQPYIISQPLSTTKPMFHSPGLSLALTGMELGQGEVSRMGENHFELSGNNKNNDSVGNNNVVVGGKRSRDEDHESRSASHNGASVDDGQDAAATAAADDRENKPSSRKKRYHRHTPQQIQELESLFKECPHPDEKQRLELSNRLCLDGRQVKFWFQNRRTQMKTQLERHENSILRQEIDKLRADNMSMKEAMRNHPICTNCGGPAAIGETSTEDQHLLRIENVRLKEELDHICALAGKFLDRSLVGPYSSLELSGIIINNGGLLKPIISPSLPSMALERSSMYLDLALAAMDELVKMAQSDEPLWVRSHEDGTERLNHEEYLATFGATAPYVGSSRPNGFVTEASRDNGMVIINSLALVETLMDSNKWAEMFPCIVARTSTTDVISSGLGGTRNGALQLMNAAIQVLSPLVPVREINFLRFCKQLGSGFWAVVDVSIDAISEVSGGVTTSPNCRKLPSGCLVQDMPNGYSKVTWVEHVEYDEGLVHRLYRPMVSHGSGFGARRWLATLQRQCESLAILMSSNSPTKATITTIGRRSMLKLARRMTDNFCSGICASSSRHKWNKLHTESTNNGDSDDMITQVMTRNSVDEPGEPHGIVLSAATSVWLPVSTRVLFDFLRDERSRSQWDILSNGAPMQEMDSVAMGRGRDNCVSLLRACGAGQGSMLILQETSIDASGALVVYAPVDIPAMQAVMNGGDSAYVALLPSGFSIFPGGPGGPNPNGRPGDQSGSSSLLTVGFQILVDSLPTAKLTVESVETVNSLISCTVQKIKAALHF